MSGLSEKTNSIYIVFTSYNHSPFGCPIRDLGRQYVLTLKESLNHV